MEGKSIVRGGVRRKVQKNFMGNSQFPAEKRERTTLSGGALGDSNLRKAIVFFIISAVTGVLGFVVYKILFSKNKKNKNEDGLVKTNKN